MSDHLDKYNCNYEKLFANFPRLKNKEVFPTLEEVYNEYQNYKKDRKEFVFFDKVLGKPWQLARCGLTDELDHQKIKLGDIVDCINQEKLQKETAKANKIFPFFRDLTKDLGLEEEADYPIYHNQLIKKKKPLVAFLICIDCMTNGIFPDEYDIEYIRKGWNKGEDDNDKKRIKDYLGLSKKQFNNLKIEPAICQIPIGQKFRAFVVFRKKQLYLLFFDPNHHFFPNKFEYPQGDNAICLIKCLTKKGNCSKFYECHPLPEKERRRLISKREREKKVKIFLNDYNAITLKLFNLTLPRRKVGQKTELSYKDKETYSTRRVLGKCSCSPHDKVEKAGGVVHWKKTPPINNGEENIETILLFEL
ncbi:16831_t:CDS:2, partial [Racocetra persica]